VNGDDSSTNNSLAISEEKTQLFSAFAALSLPDQYDAVLTGLCAKLLDDKKSNNLDKQALQDPMQLVQEMNEKNIPASPRSLMALVDVSYVLCLPPETLHEKLTSVFSFDLLVYGQNTRRSYYGGSPLLVST
jgi:hypothetical protein